MQSNKKRISVKHTGKGSGISLNQRFTVEERGPTKLKNKRIQILLDQLATIWSMKENLVEFYMVTIVADPESTIEDSWKQLHRKLDILHNLFINSGNIQMMIWGVECHRKGKSNKELPKASTLLGKCHIHLVMGIGSKVGKPIKDRELKLMLLTFFIDVTVKKLESYKDLCNSMGYILKEYNMGDVHHNLRLVGEHRRYNLIMRSRFGQGVKQLIDKLNILTNILIIYQEVFDTPLLPLTSNKSVQLAYIVINYLNYNKMLITKKGEVYKIREGTRTCYTYDRPLSEVIFDVSLNKGLPEPLMNGRGPIEQYILDFNKSNIYTFSMRYIELKDVLIDIKEGQVLSFDDNKIKTSMGFINKPLGLIRYPKEFVEYLDKAIYPEDREAYMESIYCMSQGLRRNNKSIYISGTGGTGKSMIFREGLKKIAGNNLAVIKPSDLKEPFGLEGLIDKNLLVLEEFQKSALDSQSREKTLLLLEGEEIEINIKYRPKGRSIKGLPVVVISNMTVKQVSANLDETKLLPFERRVEEIRINPTGIDLSQAYPVILDNMLEVLVYITHQVKGIYDTDGNLLSEDNIFLKD